MTRAKLCGITTATDRDAAVAAGADAIGVIVEVDVETHRELPAGRAADLLADLPPLVTGVLVTMPGTVREALSVQGRVGADAIQVHGTLDPDAIGTLRTRTDVPVIAATDAGSAPKYAGAADAVLVDSVDEAGGGGTGRTQDWERVRETVADLAAPVVLAGGLTPGNVREAIETVDPFAVDTASGIEAPDGRKDPEAMRAFVRRARGGVRA